MASWITGPVGERRPNANVCYDPFHLIKLSTDALDEIRREVWNDARRQGQLACAVWPSTSCTCSPDRIAEASAVERHRPGRSGGAPLPPTFSARGCARSPACCTARQRAGHHECGSRTRPPPAVPLRTSSGTSTTRHPAPASTTSESLNRSRETDRPCESLAFVLMAAESTAPQAPAPD
jgi:hypothetical protein